MQGGGGGEVRRVHVVYFLSRHGEIEQPHLIRVRRRAPHRDGVRLRDVKRWLSELRGKGMPDSYSWSYKRRYRTGYVWQDLADDDLITPVSDNEYVLKGSLTAAASTRSSFSSSSSPTISSPSAPVAGCPSRLADTFHRGHPKPAPPPETPPARKPDCHDEEDRRRRADAVRDVDRSLRADAAAGPPPQASPCASCEIVEEGQPEDGAEEKKGVDPTSAPYCSLGQRRRSYAWCGGYGGRSPLLFRDLLRCGAAAAEVDDSALLPINPRRRGQPRRGGGGGDGDGEAIVLSGGSHRDPTEDGASGRCRGEEKSWSASRAGEAGGGEQKATAPAEANKLAKPSCSQCGRPFKPERLHSHMKSCRALKGQRKNMSSGKLPKEVEAQRAVLSEEASSFFLQSLVIR